jgi:hypothetical protein
VKTYQTLLFAFAIFAAFAEGQPFDRYQTIIDRKPFGPEPANFDPEAAPGTASAAGAAGAGEMTPEQRTAEEQNLASKVRVSILNKAPDGTVKVGFTDSSANPPENYYLKVGGSQNGWTVKSAEPAAESVTLEKDGIEVTMKLGEGSGGKGGSKEVAKGGALRRGFPPLGGNKDGRLAGGGAPARLGGVARMRLHRIEMEAKQREEAERKREADAAAKAEQAEREAREQEEKQRLAEERAQQREALLQIQEQLRKQREEREAARQAQQEEAPE